MRFMALISFMIITLGGSSSFAQNSANEENRAQIQEILKQSKAQRQILSEDKKNTYKQARQEKLKAISTEKKLLSESRTKKEILQNMTEEERKTYMQKRRSKWNMLTPEEKEAKRQSMVDRWSQLPPEVRTRRKEKFNNMPEERKQAFQERHPDIYQDLIAE